MEFLIVNNVVNIQQNTDIISILERGKLDYFVFEMKNIINFNPQEVLLNLDKNKNYLSLGSYNFALYLKQNGFSSGHNFDNLSFDVQANEWGIESFVNNKYSIVKSISELDCFKGKMFLRPLKDSKSFNAGVYSYEELKNINNKEELIISNVKDILGEYRFIIINGKIADHCSYKINTRPNIKEKATEKFKDFVEDLISKWIPTKNFVLDIADIDGSPYVIEVNNIHCSRFYNCSPYKIIELALYS